MAKPLIKWPGGKSTELNQYVTLIPAYDRYVEPFAGGAALYFHLNPEKAVLGDRNEDLMRFYRMVKTQDPVFRETLEMYDRTFTALKELCEKRYEEIRTLYLLCEFADKQKLPLEGLEPHKVLTERIASDETVLSELIIDREHYLKVMRDSVWDKIQRTMAHSRRRAFPEQDLKDNLITGFTSGFYLYFRDVFNQIASGALPVSEGQRAANFYFIREYCYGSMVRYNMKGEFNIPYGGKSYNDKDLSAKITRMFSDSTSRLMNRTDLFCGDFEELLNSLELTDRDFVFLDPPVLNVSDDPEESDEDFTREDQLRLAEWVKKTPATFVMVMQESAEARMIYGEKFRIISTENRRGHNIKKRSAGAVEYMIVTNVPEDEVPWLWENV